MQLTTGEFALLSLLAQHAGHPLSRDRLWNSINSRLARIFRIPAIRIESI